MKNRSRLAAKVTGVLAAGALLFGVAGPAAAAPLDVEYRIDTGTITLPSAAPVVIPLPAATGIVGTWDDATGDFTGDFTSEPFTSSRDVTSPVVGTITQTVEILAPDPITGNIDPATGLGTLNAVFNVNITIDSLLIPPATVPTPIGALCTITGVNATYAVVATGLGVGSEIPTELEMTSAFTVPAATCIIIATGDPAPALITDGLNGALALPNTAATSALTFVAGAIPPQAPTTTTTTAAPTTTTTTTVPPAAPPATPVGAAARFTG